jgi:hypothetical protein
MLNMYYDMCWDIIESLDSFHISYVPKEENREANVLAQQVSGYKVTKGMFVIKREPATQRGFTRKDESVEQCCVSR